MPLSEVYRTLTFMTAHQLSFWQDDLGETSLDDSTGRRGREVPGRMLNLHRSNSMEALVGALTEVLVASPLLPLQSEWIVVPGPAIHRWLAAKLSERLGVWANARFPFPRSLVDQVVASVLRGKMPFRPLEGALADSMFWAIYQELELGVSAAGFESLRGYLDRGESVEVRERKRFALARRLANLFERYTVYRPDLLRTWEQDDDSDWQGRLWRRICDRFGTGYAGAFHEEALQALGQGVGPLAGIPTRVCLFGISGLPPLYTQIISAMATRVEVHLFALSPSVHYWADLTKKDNRSLGTAQEGNPLLVSLGRVAGDFQHVIEEHAQYNEAGNDLYRAPKAVGTMLATLQADILHLRHRGADSSTPDDQDAHPGPLRLLEGDRSISFHCCHSPMREVEVLHDQLVQLLEEDRSLDASDILVMAPDMEAYAPMVEAVFHANRDDRPHIPFQVADRSPVTSIPVLQAMTQILEVLRGRFSAAAVLDLLNIPVIRGRFAIFDHELLLLHRWVAESGIRWGEDEQHRTSVGQPATRENSWRFGLDRLFLGYAMDGEDEAMFGGVVPYDDMEGSCTDLLGRFADFCEVLFSARHKISEPLLLRDWVTFFSELTESMVEATEHNAGEHVVVRESLAQLAQDAENAAYEGKIPFESVCELLRAKWESDVSLDGPSSRGFFTGGVTFCRLLPTRSIPFRVICLLGMHEGAFPRAIEPLGFDRIASSPRLGDRNSRDDDRYVFLGNLLAAKDALLITYIGRNPRDNMELPPSVVVTELLEVLEDSFTNPGGKVRDSVVVKHPLQPFSPRYFDSNGDGQLFSYSRSFCDGANALVTPCNGLVFMDTALATPADSNEAVSVSDLVRFFRQPARFFLERRLGVYLSETGVELLETEPIEPRGLDDWYLGQTLLDETLRRGCEPSELYELFRGLGMLPLGRVGLVWFEQLAPIVSRLVELGRPFQLGTERQEDVEIELRSGSLVGRIDNLRNGARVCLQYGRLAGTSEIGHWILHLALCAVSPADQSVRTIVVGRSETSGQPSAIEFGPVADAREELERLVALYRVGQRVPLPFFPASARTFVQKLERLPPEPSSETFDRAMVSAQSRFLGGYAALGEAQELNVAHVFDTDACLGLDYRPVVELPADYAPFPVVAEMVWGPLLANRRAVHS